jgi:tetratricopeptide (TPR) repeat protein
MTPYGGGGRAHGGYVRVRDPGKGFFVAGSTIREVNGVYQRVHTLPSKFHELHGYQLVYLNQITKWYMALVDKPSPEKGYGPYGGGSNEWLIIDSNGKDRFGHVGDTIIPGSGDRWGHLDSRYGGAMEPEDDPLLFEEADIDIDGNVNHNNKQMLTLETIGEWHAKRRDQLPWQVIMIGGEDMLNNLQNHANHREYRSREALRNFENMIGHNGGDENTISSQQYPPIHFATNPETISQALDIEAIEAIQKANDLFLLYFQPKEDNDNEFDNGSNGKEMKGNAAQWNEVAELFNIAGSLCYQSLKRRKQDMNTKWMTAFIELRTGVCLRLARKPLEASMKIRNALLMYPRYTFALYELALCQLDGYNYDGALNHFETILSLDRKFPLLYRWLLITTAHTRRAVESQSTNQHQHQNHDNNNNKEDYEEEEACVKIANNPNHYAVLGLSVDFTPEELKRAYRSSSLRYHPDKVGGSQDAFARVALAHSILGNKDTKEEFDLGKLIPASYADHDDIKRGLGPYLAEEVEDKYFPEIKPFWPFGDPFEEMPTLKLRRQKLKDLAVSQQEEEWHRLHPQPDLTNIPIL